MATILFVWELGGDYGHLSRLLPVALELARRGHTPVFAVRDLMGAEAILAPHHIRVFQAPLWLGQVTNLPEPISYAEMLMRFGFLNARALTGICRAWRHLVDVIKPDLLVLDHAPTALLATRGLGLPKVNLGDGFCIPPTARPIPHFRWWQRENMARLADSEQHALACANAVLLALDAPPMLGLADLATCDDTLLCTFAELDHYENDANGVNNATHTGRSSQDYLGPIFSLGQGAEVTWPQADGPRIFAYLKGGYPGLENILAALHALDSVKASVLVHVAGVARQTVQRFSSAQMVVSGEPLSMAQASAGCDLALCHGGGGTTAAMLLAGKPLMLFPMQMEQTMTARRLMALGAAASVTPEATAQLPRLLKRMLADAGPQKAAQKFAQSHADYDQQATIRQAADRCEAQLKKARK
jgi:UDP:flavonoid glycosyltransferase YjiC (YdhE family)